MTSDSCLPLPVVLKTLPVDWRPVSAEVGKMKPQVLANEIENISTVTGENKLSLLVDLSDDVDNDFLLETQTLLE